MSTDGVRVVIDGAGLYVFAPYNKIFVDRAKVDHSGRWDAQKRAWRFRTSDEAGVRQLVLSVYGTDGSAAAETVDVLVRTGPGGLKSSGESICSESLGRDLVKKSERDTTAWLTEGVSLHSGPRFPSRSGSAKYPTCSDGTRVRVLLVRGVPRSLAEQAVVASPQIYRIARTREEIDAVALREERERIVARLAAIDALLSGKEESEEQWLAGDSNDQNEAEAEE